MIKPIRLSGHASNQLVRRGVSVDEVIEAIHTLFLLLLEEIAE